jgi:hypothetical protein
MADYCALVDLQAPGRLDITGTGYDAVLADLVTACSRWVDRYCKVPVNAFAQTDSAVRYYGRASVMVDTLFLDAPLLSVTTLVTGGGATLTGAQYRLFPRNGEYYTAIGLLSGVSWGWSIDGEIAVTGAWGMATTPPEPVKEATVMMAAWTFKRYMAGLQDATANLDLGQLLYSEGVPKQVQFLLSGYRWTVI